MTLRALLIEPSEARVHVIVVPDENEIQSQLAVIRQILGGHLELAHRFESGDCLLVDEEGSLKAPEHFFWIAGRSQPFAGRGLVVGKENAEGDITNAVSDADELFKSLRFSVAVELGAGFRPRKPDNGT